MLRPNNKKRPAQRFSILIVPKSSSAIKRFECSSRLIYMGIAVVVALAVFLAVGTASVAYYRHAYLSTEDVRVESAQFMREKGALMNRLSELEDALSRTERFAAKIESAVEVKRDGSTGKGPVDESDGLPVGQVLASSVGNFSGNLLKSPFSKSLSTELKLSIDDMARRADDVEGRVHSVFSKRQDKLFFWASLPSIWPARGWVTSEFGEHRGWGGRGRLHDGVDIASPRGTPILAPGDGVVTFSGYYHGYGQMVTLEHGTGISTLYGHCSSIYVREGQRVKRGTVIAAVGNTGSSTGPHLHYEVHVDGMAVNPMLYVMQ